MSKDQYGSRERSGFGQFQMKRSSTGPGADYTKVRVRPKASDMAKMLRDGKTLEEIAESVGLTTATVQHRISEAGWSGVTGKPRK